MEGKREGRAPHGWFCKGAEGLIFVPHGGEGSTFGVLGRRKSHSVTPYHRRFACARRPGRPSASDPGRSFLRATDVT